MKHAMFLSLLFLGPLGAAVLAEGTTGADSTDIEGSWMPISAQFAGENYPDQILKTMKLVVKDENYTVEVGGNTDEGTCKLDPSKSPKGMDIKGTKGPNKGKTILAIYDLEKDTLHICHDLAGKDRPTEFATQANSKLFLVTYKRVKS